MTALDDRRVNDDLVLALEPVAARELERHLAMAKEWFPHE